MNIYRKPRCRILVVDDDARARRAIRRALICNGCQVITCATGPSALARLRQNRFDAVILDRALVGFKGNELAARCKEKWPRLSIIMTSHFAVDFNRAGTTFKNVDFVLDKSFAQTELRAAIARVRPEVAPSAAPGQTTLN